MNDKTENKNKDKKTDMKKEKNTDKTKKDKKVNNKIWSIIIVVGVLLLAMIIPYRHFGTYETHRTSVDNLNVGMKITEITKRHYNFFDKDQKIEDVTYIKDRYISYHDNRIINKKIIKIRDIKSVERTSKGIEIKYGKNKIIKINCDTIDAIRIQHNIRKKQRFLR